MASFAHSPKEVDFLQPEASKGEISGSGPNPFTRLSRDPISVQNMAARSTSPRLTRSATAPAPFSQSHMGSSPITSREASPHRTMQTAAKFGGVRTTRSRKNSADHSPQRAAPAGFSTTVLSTPSASAVQRPLAAAGNSRPPSPTSTSSGVVGGGGGGEGEGDEGEKEMSKEFSDQQTPGRRKGTIQTTQAHMRSPPSIGLGSAASSKIAEQQLVPLSLNHGGSKPSVGIETIQEEEDDNDVIGTGISATKKEGTSGEAERDSGPKQTFTDVQTQSKTSFRPSTIQEDPDEDNIDMNSSQTTTTTKSSKTNAESGSGSEGTERRNEPSKMVEREREKIADSQKSAPPSAGASRKSSITQLAPSKPSALQARRSFQHLNPTRSKVQGEGSVKSLTVETETVSNPDLLADDRETRNSNGRLDVTGSVRTKASTETIRPRREKKRARKPNNIASGAVSSKADIFEAKVASAVDEAVNSSDSEETFVYDSNPHDPRSSHHSHHGHRHHHSRTPSAASMGSQTAEHRTRGNHFGIAGKKSMKFTNAHQLRDGDEDDGLSAYSNNTARSSHRHHHHIARLERMQNIAQDSDSPVSSSAKSSRARQSPNWRFHDSRMAQEQDQVLPTMMDKSGSSKVFDLSGSAEADTEFTPLLGSAGRSTRGEHRRRTIRSSRIDSYQQSPLGSCVQLIKYSCIAITVILALGVVVTGMILCNRQLYDVHVNAVRSVLPTEQELFVELEVHAMNPNLVDISIAKGDLDLFAKSKYVGTTEMWRNRTIPGIDAPLRNRHHVNAISEGGIDEGTDPIDEPGTNPQTMLLGCVHELESPLIFESSPLYQSYRNSTSGLRLAKPGNKTEEGGSRRWENVVQHEFELIIRGRLQYSLPLSSRKYYIRVSGSTKVIPEKPSTGVNRDGDEARTSKEESTLSERGFRQTFRA